jgi:hypothetical protein
MSKRKDLYENVSLRFMTYQDDMRMTCVMNAYNEARTH